MHETVKQFHGHVACYLHHYYHQIIIITIENKCNISIRNWIR